MSVTTETLERLNSHWAIEAVGKTKLVRAEVLRNERLVRSAIGTYFDVGGSETESDIELLEQVASAYEIAALEGLDALLFPSTQTEGLAAQARAGSYRAFEFLSVLPLPTEEAERVFHVLHVSALAYCGDRPNELRRWLADRSSLIAAPSAAEATWDKRVLFRLFDCWLRLFRKNQWDDLDAVRFIILGLRQDQKTFEKPLLATYAGAEAKTTAYRLVALYHFAKATELLATYMLQGEPRGVSTKLDQQFDPACVAASESRDPAFEMLLKWLHATAKRMASNSVWWVAHTVNSRVTKFVDRVTRARSMFELLPPQRVALQEQGLLDQASRAVVVNLPTSGGKTALAQFRILQALNQFSQDEGWVAYVAPTRALVAQITRRLRCDFEPLNINVEQLTSAVEVDACEESLLASPTGKDSFHVLITTPEKLHLVIRNKKITRPLALIVMDEAHNLEDEERGLRIELLLATVKADSPSTHFLLLMPFVPNAGDLAKWLSPETGKTISLGTSAWLPNERIIGCFESVKEDSKHGRAAWSLRFETLVTERRTIHLRGSHRVGTVKPLNLSFSESKSPTLQAAAMAKVFSGRGTSIAIGQTIPHTWSMARELADNCAALEPVPEEIALVQRFLKTEISPNFELVSMLGRGVGVHHAGLSEETRSLIEWLAESGKLRVLCATTTIAQGINFPVSSVFLATRCYPYGKEMPPRAFWNLAGRAGRIDQDSVGVVGIAAGKNAHAIKKYVSSSTDALVSRLVTLLNSIDDVSSAHMQAVILEEQWADFRSYVAHLWKEKQRLDLVLAETDQLLRNTFGYGVLHSSPDKEKKKKAAALLEATKEYARSLAAHPENALLADATGFAPEGVRAALLGLNGLEAKLTPSDWEPKSLFGAKGQSKLPQLVGVMLGIPQIRSSMKELGSHGLDNKRIAEIAQAWVAGKSIQEIASQFFATVGKKEIPETEAITNACKGIYRTLAMAGTWGLSALSKMPTSGLDFDKLSETQRRIINNLPAMLYHGVSSEAGVFMRMNSVPRTVAEQLGAAFIAISKKQDKPLNSRTAREFLRNLSDAEWNAARPRNAAMSGADYRLVWGKLSGEPL